MDWRVTQACGEDHVRDCGNSLGEAGCWVTWTRVTTGDGKKWAYSAYLGGIICDTRHEGEEKGVAGDFQVSGLPT